MRRLMTFGSLLLLLSLNRLAAKDPVVVAEIGGLPVCKAEYAFHGKDPASIARSRAIQILAVEAGLLPEVMSFSRCLEAFRSENQRRKEMKQAGGIFYGPVQYRFEVWFAVWTEQLTRALERQVRLRMDPLLPRDQSDEQARSLIESRIQFLTHELLKPAAQGS